MASTVERRLLTLPTTPVRLRKRKRAHDREGDEAPKDDEKPDKKEDEKEGDEANEADEGKEEQKDDGKDDKDDKGQRGIDGYAAVFHAESDPGTEYELWSDPTMRAVERIARGAFTRACKDGDDVRALYNHDPNMVLGRTASGTCRLEEDAKGLKYSIDLPDTQTGRDVAELVDRGDVNGSSFGFVVEQESWRESEESNGQRLAVRTIESVRLLDVGPVTYPAYAGTTTVARSLGGISALGDVAEARASYGRWKDATTPLPAKLAAIRARAVAVSVKS